MHRARKVASAEHKLPVLTAGCPEKNEEDQNAGGK